MNTITKLFSGSPFAPLQAHLNTVSLCVHSLTSLFLALETKNDKELAALIKQISSFEHDADQIKNNIRNNLSKSLFLPIDRSHFLEILSLQDTIADRAEDAAVTLSLHTIKLLPSFRDLFFLFLKQNIDTFDLVKKVMQELNELIESSFGGVEAEKVNRMVKQVAYSEHEVDLTQRKLLQALIQSQQQMTYAEFFIWQRLLENIAAISNSSETLAYRVRMTLELK